MLWREKERHSHAESRRSRRKGIVSCGEDMLKYKGLKKQYSKKLSLRFWRLGEREEVITQSPKERQERLNNKNR